MSAPYPGIRDLLVSLKNQGFQLCTATSKSQPITERILEHHKLAELFTFIGAATGPDGGRRSKRDVIAHVLDNVGLDEGSDILMIGDRIHDITCSIGTEGHALVAAGLQYFGSDLDPSRVIMARHNLGATFPTANAANKPQPVWGFHVADARHPATIPGAADAIIADPARRHQGRRITNPDELLPPLATIIATYPRTPMAIKCAPGIDFTGWDGLVSLVSVDGGVKEACLYSPALADGLHREAVIIRDGTMDILTDRDDPGADTPVGEPGTYIIDPDGAVIRAGLVRHYAHRENLWLLDERIAYLTGDRIPAGMSGFLYLETVPLKKLRSVLRGHDCGSVEILVRGVDVDPDRLRQKLRLSGSRPMAVVCTRIGRSGVALVCEARVVGEPPAGQPIP